MDEPGLVLLDLMMPKMDGFEFLEVLREDEAHRDVPVVVITAKEMNDEERRYLSRQVDETLKKSVGAAHCSSASFVDPIAQHVPQ